MNTAPIVRPAAETDASAMADVCARAARTAYVDLVTGDYLDRAIAHFYDAERLRSEIAPGPGWFGFVVAQVAERVVGVAGTGRSAQHADGCELYALYVDPAAQRQGIGRALVEQAAIDARGAGARRLDVAVIPGNQPALRFYDACGFSFAGERPIYAPHGQDGGPDNALVFRRTL
jgi:ribosomal protein S18 acetylase RimI-like enzyme